MHRADTRSKSYANKITVDKYLLPIGDNANVKRLMQLREDVCLIQVPTL